MSLFWRLLGMLNDIKSTSGKLVSKTKPPNCKTPPWLIITLPAMSFSVINFEASMYPKKEAARENKIKTKKKP